MPSLPNKEPHRDLPAPGTLLHRSVLCVRPWVPTMPSGFPALPPRPPQGAGSITRGDPASVTRLRSPLARALHTQYLFVKVEAVDFREDPTHTAIPWRRERFLLQYSGLENSMDSIVHGVTKSQT